MKKLFLSITMLVVAMGAFAQDEYYLKADPFTLAPGKNAEIPIELINTNEDVRGVQCDIIVPTGLRFLSYSGDYGQRVDDRLGTGKKTITDEETEEEIEIDVTQDPTLGSNVLEKEGTRVVRIRITLTDYNSNICWKGTSGPIFKIRVAANADSPIQQYELKIQDIAIAKSEGSAQTKTEYIDKAFVFPVLKETEKFPSFEGTLDGVDVTMNRVVKEGYNTMVLPFDMTNDEVVAAFGEGTKVYAYTETAAGKIKFNTSTDGIAANTPVLVKATKAIAADENQIFTGKKVAYAEAGTVPGMSYTFTGNYEGQITIEAGDYIFNNGSLLKSQGGSTLKSYRAYIASNGGSVKGLSLEIDDVPTGIELVNGEVETVGDIYTVGGQLVRRNSTVKGLPEGIYMINGNKVVVRK